MSRLGFGHVPGGHRQAGKDKIKAAAEQAGESVNAFINAAIQERMQKDAGD